MTFKECLKKGRIKEFSQGKDLVQKELKTAEKDLLDGKEGFERKKYKWTTIQSYYAMFHSARALLYAKNYREKSHHCLIIALRHLYVDIGKLPGYYYLLTNNCVHKTKEAGAAAGVTITCGWTPESLADFLNSQ